MPRYKSTPCYHCGKKKLVFLEDDLQHGNPMTPASDVDLYVTYECKACGEKTVTMGYL